MPLLGFLGRPAPSRKQWDWYRDRQGPQKRLENPVTRVVSIDWDIIAGSFTQVAYAAPSGYRARLLYLQVNVVSLAAVNTYQVNIDGARLYFWDSGWPGPAEVSQRWTIDDGPQFFSSISVQYSAGGASTPGFRVSAIVNLEPAADGEYVTV